MQDGYFYPWRSTVAPGNGEDAYLRLLEAHLAPEKVVLDVGCGHGETVLYIAPRCRWVIAYDRVGSFIRMARKAANERKASNVSFLLADSSERANGGRPRIPARDDTFDLLVSRRGPLHWIEDARRVARPGAGLLQLNPVETPPPIWNGELPAALRFADRVSDIRTSVEARLASGGLTLHSCWTFDVPESFGDPDQLYLRLSWGKPDVPLLQRVRRTLANIFARHAAADGLRLRHRRFLWKAVVTP